MCMFLGWFPVPAAPWHPCLLNTCPLASPSPIPIPTPQPVAAISRPELSKRVVGNPEALRRLEAIVHPLVTAEKVRWLRQQAAAGQVLVVLDIPLLFETGAEAQCDAVAVASAPAEAQRARALARPGMTEAKLDGLLARQVGAHRVGGDMQGSRPAGRSLPLHSGRVASSRQVAAHALLHLSYEQFAMGCLGPACCHGARTPWYASLPFPPPLSAARQVPDTEKRRRADFVIDTVRPEAMHRPSFGPRHNFAI